MRGDHAQTKSTLNMSSVLVAGSINMDVVATAERHPRVGETVAGKDVLYFPGGKGANQAVAAAKLGARTALIGRLGKDAFGAELRAFLTGQGVDVSLVRETAGVHTGTAIITLADADNTIVVIPGANGSVTPEDVAAVPFAKGDIAVSQFEIPVPAVTAFFARARTAGATTILNPAPARAIDGGLLDLVDILVLNETELGFLTGLTLHEDDHFDSFFDAARTLQAHPAQIICVTLGKRGAVALMEDTQWMVQGRKVEAVDTTGAGDCFVGAVAAVLAHFDQIRSDQIKAALAYGNDAAAVCVQRMGAAPSMPTIDEVRAAIRGYAKPARP
jgi:ribokinase